jgi:hypothetical protein
MVLEMKQGGSSLGERGTADGSREGKMEVGRVGEMVRRRFDIAEPVKVVFRGAEKA